MQWSNDSNWAPNAIDGFEIHWGYGATVARLTPDQKVGSSNLSALIFLMSAGYPRQRATWFPESRGFFFQRFQTFSACLKKDARHVRIRSFATPFATYFRQRGPNGVGRGVGRRFLAAWHQIRPTCLRWSTKTCFDTFLRFWLNSESAMTLKMAFSLNVVIFLWKCCILWYFSIASMFIFYQIPMWNL